MTKNASATVREDIYTRVTATIISSLKQGVRPWMKPSSVEHTAGRITKALRCCGTLYRGMNVLLLWVEAVERGYAAPIWMTYKQAQERGGQVRKGEKSAQIVYADCFKKTETDEKGEGVERDILQRDALASLQTHRKVAVVESNGIASMRAYAQRRFAGRLPDRRSCWYVGEFSRFREIPIPNGNFVSLVWF